MTTDAQICRLAKAEIQRRGWCQRQFRDLDGKQCMYAAIDSVSEGRRATPKMYEALSAVSEYVSILGYNDTPGRTQAEVEEMLERMAELLEGWE